MAESNFNSRNEERNPRRSCEAYCHSCQRTVDAILPDMICPQCNDGFVEEITMQDHQRSENPNPHSAVHQGAVPSPQTVVFRLGGGASGGRPFQMFMTDVGLPQSSGSNSDGNRAPRNPIETILSQVLSGFGAVMHGNPGDYVWGPGGLDAIITQLLNNVEGSGPPPADQEKIDSLPNAKISANQVANNIQCSVCFDDFKLDEEVKVLPCRHHYHQDCIIPWLEMHGTCPVCRKDLNGDDTTTQEFDGELGETISNLNTRQSGRNQLQTSGQSNEAQTGNVTENSTTRSNRIFTRSHPSLRNNPGSSRQRYPDPQEEDVD